MSESEERSEGARRYLVSGRVQGVGFRYFVLDCARALGLTGYTRNLPDGRVEVLAQGAAGSLKRLERDLRRGPSLSRVDGLDVGEATLDPERIGFQVTY